MADLGEVLVKGRRLRCQHCGGQQFLHKTATLDRPILGGLVRLEGYWGHEAAIYVCSCCGFAHFFMPVPEADHHFAEAAPVEKEEACLSCGKPIPSDAAKCPSCGWSWAPEGVPGQASAR